MVDRVKISYLNSEYINTCFLTSEQQKFLGLDEKIHTITLTIGTLKIILKKIILDDNNLSANRLYLSQDIKNQIYISEGTLLQIKSTGNEQIELGPFIGVFINLEKVEYLNSGKGITAYTHFDSACKNMCGLCCFFSIEGIDWDKNLVKGLIKSNSKWTMITLPLPKIIYDRNVENNCRAESIELRERLRGTCHIINSMPKLAKWETIIALKKSPALLPLIPDTIIFNSSSEVDDMLQKYPAIYLKPDSLSKGKGIYRISKTSNHEYKVEYRTKEENHIVTLPTLDDLDKLLAEYSAKGGGYLIQQEIKKADYKGNPFDFRLLYQKDWQGIWQPSGIAGRIAAHGSIVTCPRSGGSVEQFPAILRETFNEDITVKDGLYEKVVRSGREIAFAIEREFGDCVELGLDMTIDVNRKIWVIEVNGKPLKVSLKRLGDPSLLVRCNKRPIEYAVYITGFKAADSEFSNSI